MGVTFFPRVLGGFLERNPGKKGEASVRNRGVAFFLRLPCLFVVLRGSRQIWLQQKDGPEVDHKNNCPRVSH